MSRKALIDQNHELIMAHILDPDNSPLPPDQQAMLDRIISMSMLLQKYPTAKHVVAIHQSKFSDISQVTAYADLKLARKVYNNVHEFDYDFYRMWLINDIMKSIEIGRKRDTYQSDRVIAQDHATLFRILGDKPTDIPDPQRNEKHEFYIMVNYNDRDIKVDINDLHAFPKTTLQELNKKVLSQKEIDDTEAAEIINS